MTLRESMTKLNDEFAKLKKVIKEEVFVPNRKHGFWDWMIVIVLGSLVAWCLLGCNLPKRTADTEPIGPYHVGGTDTGTQKIHWFYYPVDTICEHQIDMVNSSNPPSYHCSRCKKDLSAEQYQEDWKHIQQSRCDHFFVSEAYDGKRMYCVKCELIINQN